MCIQVSFAPEAEVQAYGQWPPTDMSGPASESEGACRSDWDSGREGEDELDRTSQPSAQLQSSEPSQVITSGYYCHTSSMINTHTHTYTYTQESGSDLVSACQQADWDCAQVLMESGSVLEGRNQVRSPNQSPTHDSPSFLLYLRMVRPLCSFAV